MKSVFSVLAFLGLLTLLSDAALASNGPAQGAECVKDTLGGMICNMINGSYTGAAIITGFAYVAGLICGLFGILKLKDHVENPNQVPIWEPIKRFAAGGAFFVLPYVAEVVQNTIEGQAGADVTAKGFNGTSSGVGLDAMIVRLVANLFEPTIWAIGFVGWIGGLILVFIGISRLLKSEQDGPRGPSGIGTVTTFLIAGCLLSLNSIVAYLNATIFDTTKLSTYGTLAYTQGLNGTEAHVHAVISGITAFSMLVGWISLVRGLYIVRGVSEGNSQASMMAGVTHLVGGALAINLGAVINAVQATLDIAKYGINFT